MDLREMTIARSRRSDFMLLKSRGHTPDASICERELQVVVMTDARATEVRFDVICGELASLARVNDPGMHWSGSMRPRAGRA
jgi:hypothetical protein